MLLLFTNSLMIIHLGINPVKGGSPPRDMSTIRMMVVMRGCLFQELERERVVVLLFVWRSINMLVVRII